MKIAKISYRLHKKLRAYDSNKKSSSGHKIRLLGDLLIKNHLYRDDAVNSLSDLIPSLSISSGNLAAMCGHALMSLK